MRTVIIIAFMLLLPNSLFACGYSTYPETNGLYYNPHQCTCTLNLQDNQGNTLLHKVAANGHVLMVKRLLSLGADPTIANNGGMLPVDVAKLRCEWCFGDYPYCVCEIMQEKYNGVDDDCNGIIDDALPQPEACNDFDDDCNALIDDGCCRCWYPN